MLRLPRPLARVVSGHVRTCVAVRAQACQLAAPSASVAQKAAPQSQTETAVPEQKPAVECKWCKSATANADRVCDACAWVASRTAPGELSPFKMLGCAECMHLKLEKAEAEYRRLQNVLHPDRFARAPEEEQLLAQKHSAKVNEAIAIVRCPLRRAIELCKLHGVDPLAEEQRIQDMELMMESMEIAEELEEADADGASAVLKRVNERIGQHVQKFAKARDADDWDTAVQHVQALQLFTRLAEQAAGHASHYA
mmetsp:Transcript_62525/g.144022  ORF Transcript_62525/g.144022 Transcript_62525/m.144022 type:complete len:253 (+) Transcript_62525:63-821(+)